jgi:hypothetical protein
MRTSVTSFFCVTALLSIVLGASELARAALVTLSPDDVAVLVGGFGLEDSNQLSTNFSTHGAGTQRTVVGTSNASLIAALQGALGPSGSYQILSAKLTVGSDADDYAPGVTVTGHVLQVSYFPNQVTWNSRSTGTLWAAPGAQSGTDYASVAATTATPTAGHTSTERDFAGLESVVQNWIDSATPNNGLIFLTPSVETLNNDFTAYTNVVWTIDAIVPEPTSMALFALGTLGLLRVRRRHELLGDAR